MIKYNQLIITLTIWLLLFYWIFHIFSPNTKLQTKVTKIIHQSWKIRKIPRVFERFYPSWKKCFPNWTHLLWTDEDNRNLVIDHFPWFLEIYDSFPQEIYRADVSRYLYLYRYGGLYTDMDNECLSPFEHLLENYTIVFGSIDNVDRVSPLRNYYVQNSFMYSNPRQSFWLELVRNIKFQYNYDSPVVVTGPDHLSLMIYKYLTRFPDNRDMRIYDAWYFNPLSWGSHIKHLHCKIQVIMSDSEWIACRKRFIKNGSYVVQYHVHSWGNDDDYSD